MPRMVFVARDGAPLAGAQTLLNEIAVRANGADEGPFDRNVEKLIVLEGFGKSARADFCRSLK